MSFIDVCSHCKRKGHNIKTCEEAAIENAKRIASQPINSKIKTCGNCRKVGYSIKICPDLINTSSNKTTISLKDVLEQMKDDICDNCGFKGHNKQLCLIELKDIQKYELKYQIKNKYK